MNAKVLFLVSSLFLVACSGSDDLHLCDNPDGLGCTVTPTHPPLDLGKDYVKKPDPTLQKVDQDSGVVTAPFCEVAIINELRDYACNSGISYSETWLFWPTNDPELSPGSPCDTKAVLPAAGEECYVPSVGEYGIVKIFAQ